MEIYDKKEFIKAIFATILILGLIALIVLFSLQTHYRYKLEFNAQIEKLGFYKMDMILLFDNHIKFNFDILGITFSCIGAALLGFYAYVKYENAIW